MSPRQELLLLAASPDLALEALRWTESACARAGLDAVRSGELASAVVEAVNNSLEHGYRAGTGNVSLVLEDDADRVVVTVGDHGSGLPPAPSAGDPPAHAERGRGSWLMQQYCDGVAHERRGDLQCVVLVKLRREPVTHKKGESS